MGYSKRTGKCRQCGNCCRDFYIEMNVEQVTDHEFTEYIKWLNCHVGTEATIKDYKKRRIEVHIQNQCKHLTDNGDGTFSCAIHEDKPDICKHYPDEDYGDEVSKKCGYRFV